MDGNGLAKIEDPNLARALLDKVNTLNINTALQTLIATTIFAALPKDVTAPLAFFALLFVTLYFSEGKLSDES